MNPQPLPPPRVVIKSTTLRDSLIGGGCAVAILAALGFGISHLNDKPTGNTLSGQIVKKTFVPAPEEQISFGRKGLKTRRIEGEYLFEVRVQSAGRTFEVPVDKLTFERKAVGDTQTFLRPPSEQK